ncbi:MAG: MFS transporter, partial [bacterium]
LGMVFQGVWWAGYLLVPFVLAKSLAASGGLITLAVTMDFGGMLLAVYWGYLLTRGSRRRLILWSGVLGRLGLVAGIFLHSAGQFVALLAVVYFCAALVYPAQNGILQVTIRPRRQGRIWGLGTAVQNGVAVLVSIAMGQILDHDPGLFKVLYAGIGVCGFVHLWILARLPQPGERRHTLTEPFAEMTQMVSPAVSRHPVRLLWQPFLEAVATFRQDRRYLWFEANFMTYGLAFMVLMPILPILFNSRLHLDYEQISTARVLIAQSGVALLGPFMGRFMDRYHPARLCQLAFALMILFPLGLILASRGGEAQGARFVYLAFVCYALGMAGVNIAWNVGSITFAPNGMGSHYQGIHVAMVGIRGLLGPGLGFAVYRFLGLERVFWLAAVLFLAASISSAGLGRWLSRQSAGGGEIHSGAG